MMNINWFFMVAQLSFITATISVETLNENSVNNSVRPKSNIATSKLSWKEVVRDFIRTKRNVYGNCKRSIDTVKIVHACPHNETEWLKAAERKKCWDISQNCTSQENFVYHCLINSWGNQTLEVCAVKKYIIGGYCAEFNMNGARIQEHYDKSCASLKDPCQSSYESTDAFKYQECYNIYTNHQSTLDTKALISAANQLCCSKILTLQIVLPVIIQSVATI